MPGQTIMLWFIDTPILEQKNMDFSLFGFLHFLHIQKARDNHESFSMKI